MAVAGTASAPRAGYQHLLEAWRQPAITTTPTQVGPYLPYDCYLDYLCDFDTPNIIIDLPGRGPRPQPQ
jgi:hypothetical protein